MKPIAILLIDFYKAVHAECYDPRITKLVSYYIPRGTRIKEWDFVPVIGIQRFVQEWLIDYFNKNFFELDEVDVIRQYSKVIRETLGDNRLFYQKIINLHRLGYLPLEIRALDEGTRAPIKTPIIEISNTHPDFAWCTNVIESLLSTELWHPMVTGMVGVQYRNIANKWFEKTCDNPELARHAISDFSLRGTMGISAANRATAGFLMSFDRTSTVPAIMEINHYYGDLLGDIAHGMASTEHSIACSSFALDGTEEKLFERLLNDIYPDGNFSYVADSYDYWSFINNTLPKYKDQIINREGTVFVRGDSGDPVEIIVGTVERLWNIFGGTINNKGYKILDKHIRAIYGDSITPRRAETIYSRLSQIGFSSENVALGAGSFSMLCWEEEDGYICKGQGSAFEPKYKLSPFTRDTFNVAVKTSYGECKTGQRIDHEGSYGPPNGLLTYTEGFDIIKNPKTDTENFKKSQKGCCMVYEEYPSKKISFDDGWTLEQAHDFERNLLTPVFLNGKLVKQTSFKDIRNRLWNDSF